jgi:hypothetical protein
MSLPEVDKRFIFSDIYNIKGFTVLSQTLFKSFRQGIYLLLKRIFYISLKYNVFREGAVKAGKKMDWVLGLIHLPPLSGKNLSMVDLILHSTLGRALPFPRYAFKD